MPIYLIVAYVIFCTVPLGLGIVFHVRLRRLMQDIDLIEHAVDDSLA